MKVRYAILAMAVYATSYGMSGKYMRPHQTGPRIEEGANVCDSKSVYELRKISQELDSLFKEPVVYTRQWNKRVSELLNQLPYSQYFTMHQKVKARHEAQMRAKRKNIAKPFAEKY